ncbi:hypothetical protein CHELA40_14028 [Chelatococcus asaccharovorans]|nr:hypothetical protein CHELA17_61598 [Chelatococcus asaccharovorans]CAH1674665.1 hypothetical protein CHELA40_14028 [Chelatococcus asaccharovorans]
MGLCRSRQLQSRLQAPLCRDAKRCAQAGIAEDFVLVVLLRHLLRGPYQADANVGVEPLVDLYGLIVAPIGGPVSS